MINDKIPLIDQSSLGKKGVFYVGGRYGSENGRHYVCNQMFVEVYVPTEITHPYPVIMFHGAGQTNVNWLMTPDGRMGWADYFVSQGFCVYLAEQPARGRSAYHPSVNGSSIFHSVGVIQNRFTSAEGSWPQAAKHNQWPGSGTDWEDDVFWQFISSQVEYLPSNRDSQELVLEAGKELLKLTGPAILLTHSQAGPFGWLLADACPELVRGIVALEPSGPPFSTDLEKNMAQNYGITELPLRFDPSVSEPEELELRLLKSEQEGLEDGWILKESNRKLPNFKGLPVLLMVSEASYHAGYDHLTSRVLNQCGVKHDFVRLEEIGIHGNGHMMMLEKNNLEIAGWIAGWLNDHVR